MEHLPAGKAAEICVTSEIGTLKKILIHSPDGGIGKVTPDKFHDWLYDDTVWLKKMQQEYDDYVKVLLHFLDADKIEIIGKSPDVRDTMNPGKENYFASSKVLDAQWIFGQILATESEEIRQKIITAVCAIENCNSKVQAYLEQIRNPELLAKILITGMIPQYKKHEDLLPGLPPGTDDENEEIYIFPPVPNFVFTRDIGVVINQHFLLSKPAKLVRRRESLLTKYIAQLYLFRNHPDRIIEITEHSEFFLLDDKDQEEQVITIEGGDIMMTAPNHLIVGCSERTSPNAVNEIIHEMFQRSSTGIEWVSVVKIPRKRAQMHIDTLFTQVSRDVWVLYGELSEELKVKKAEKRKSYLKDLLHIKEKNEQEEEKVEIIQFYKPLDEKYEPSKDYMLSYQEDYERAYKSPKLKGTPNRTDYFYMPESIDALLRQISRICFGVKNTKIIYSGGDRYPYDSREQWTDACNLLVLKEGVAIGYDRNDETIKEFEKEGFTTVSAKELLRLFETGEWKKETLEKTLILLESGELSRGRGGSHCMSMPLYREPVI